MGERGAINIGSFELMPMPCRNHKHHHWHALDARPPPHHQNMASPACWPLTGSVPAAPAGTSITSHCTGAWADREGWGRTDSRLLSVNSETLSVPSHPTTPTGPIAAPIPAAPGRLTLAVASVATRAAVTSISARA